MMPIEEDHPYVAWRRANDRELPRGKPAEPIGGPIQPTFAFRIGCRQALEEDGINVLPPEASRDFGTPYSVLVDGRLAVSVPLKGGMGAGKRMLLDAHVWDRIRLALGERWHLRDSPGGGYVISGRKQATKHSNRPDVLILSRYVAHARPGQVVAYRDGDPLNLTRGNLEVLDREVFTARVFGLTRKA